MEQNELIEKITREVMARLRDAPAAARVAAAVRATGVDCYRIGETTTGRADVHFAGVMDWGRR